MTIKLKIQILALIAVLVPFSVLGYFAYTHSVRLNQAQFGQELLSLGSLVARETGRHVERLRVDVEAFAVSPLLQQAIAGEETALLRAEAYFASLLSRFPDYRRFSLADNEGASIGANGGAEEQRRLTGKTGVGVVMAESGEPLLRVTVPVAKASGAMSGYLVADIGLRVLQPLLESTAGKKLYLVSTHGRLLDSAGAIHSPSPITTDSRTPVSGFESVMLYPDHRGVTVLGLIVPTRVTELRVLAEMDAEGAFAELSRLKTRALWILAAVLVPLIAATHFFGASLVRPLIALTDGARRVANGDLDVDLPSARRDEIGYLSRVFNDMVERLQESRRAVAAAQSRLLEQNRRLEELTVTDNLTGLANRRSLTENLMRNLARYRRNGRSFSVLILDLDHFKSVNDRYGHLAGDAVLRRFATRLSESIRNVDFAARYGGEEFTVILFETGHSDAWESAERIRVRVEQMRVEVEPAVVLAITASIGIAEACAADVEPDDLLQRADAAMYQAKQAGRNRVCFAATPETDANGLT